MAHKEQVDFCLKVKEKFPHFFKNKIVVDIGSLDINGNNQYLFENCLYIGVDIGVGKNVDFVCKGHELKLPDESVDVIISTECFEHDMYYEETLKNIYRMLKPGGFFIFSCATTGRPEHGTRRTTPKDAPLLLDDNAWSDYYKNLTPNDIQNVYDINTLFSIYYFEINTNHFDMCFYGVKSGIFNFRNNYSFLIDKEPKYKLKHFKTHVKLYIYYENKYSEDKCIRSDFNNDVLDLAAYRYIELSQLRFDPSNKKCIISNFQAWLIDEAGKEYVCDILRHNAALIKNEKYYFDTTDSQIHISVPISNPKFFKYSFEIEDIENSAFFSAYKLLNN